MNRAELISRMNEVLTKLLREKGYIDTDREKRASFDRQASATDSVSFLGLFPPKANKTVFFFVSFHQGATQSGILFLVSIERGTSPRVYHHRPWLSDMSQLGGAPRRFLARLAVARVGVSDRSAEILAPRASKQGSVVAYHATTRQLISELIAPKVRKEIESMTGITMCAEPRLRVTGQR